MSELHRLATRDDQFRDTTRPPQGPAARGLLWSASGLMTRFAADPRTGSGGAHELLTVAAAVLRPDEQEEFDVASLANRLAVLVEVLPDLATGLGPGRGAQALRRTAAELASMVAAVTGKGGGRPFSALSRPSMEDLTSDRP
jgi:hypothetical protein